MGNLRPFTINCAIPVAAAGTGSFTFELNNQNKRFKLRSVLFDLQLFETVSGLILPIANNTSQMFYLLMRSLEVPANFAQNFDFISGAGAIAYNGSGSVIYTPGQYFFNSLNILNDLRFTFTYANNDALLDYTYNLNCFVEIEDIEKLN